jgi:hypothetical protein
MTTLALSPGSANDEGNSGTGSGYNVGVRPQLGGYYGTANGWFRVTNVTIAQGSAISDFRLTVARISSAGTADLIFTFEKAANPTYPTSSVDFDGRTNTTANATSSYSGVGTLTSPNCSAAAQEVTDQGSWVSGNAQILYVKDNNSNANHGGFENRAQVAAYNEGASSPVLTWTYTAGAPAGQPIRKRLAGLKYSAATIFRSGKVRGW